MGGHVLKIDRRKTALILCAALALLLPRVRTIVISFALALFLAGCLQRPIEGARRHHVPRVVTALALLVLVLAPLAALTGYGVYRLLHSARAMLELLLPLLRENGSFEDWLYRFVTSLPPDLQTLLEGMLATLTAQKDALLGQLVGKLGEWSSSFLSALPGQLAKTGFFLLFFLFCAIGYPEIRGMLRALLPGDWLRWLGKFQRETKQRLGRWCSAEARLVALIFGELALGLSMLRLESWLWMAAMIALVDMVPLVGSGIILLPWAAARFLLGHPVQAVGLVLLWFCAWFTRTVLEPRLVGHQLQLPTAISFLAAIVGANVWGLKGLILFPVLAAVVIGLLSREKKGAAPKSGALDAWDRSDQWIIRH